jgi:DNA-binding NtrC family response regulator
MTLFHILVVTAKKRLAETIRCAAEGQPDVELLEAGSIERAREILESALLDLVVIDLAIEEGRGIDLVLGIRHAFPDLSIFVVTDKHLRSYDKEAMKVGVDGYLVQPVQEEHVFFDLSHIREVRRLREQYRQLRSDVEHGPAFGEIIGNSGVMRRVFDLISRAAGSSVPVAVYGESGTGKELVAHAIHRHSERRDKPFLCINPSSIPESLLESELFGHVRGAFTGALSERAGYFEAAHGGTLFLDEIGDLPLTFQGKFLRVLQEKTIHRVGSTKPIPVDFRLITATHRDLMALVAEGKFREDLFYRIHVFPIYLPPLRQRRGDIRLLAEHFARKYAAEQGRTIHGLSSGALEFLYTYSWPGNVRELENVIQRSVAMKRDGTLLEEIDIVGMGDGVQAPPRSTPAAAPPEIKPLEQHVREYIAWAYRALGQNKARTARMLEIDRTTLYRKLGEIEPAE